MDLGAVALVPVCLEAADLVAMILPVHFSPPKKSSSPTHEEIHQLRLNRPVP